MSEFGGGGGGWSKVVSECRTLYAIILYLGKSGERREWSIYTYEKSGGEGRNKVWVGPPYPLANDTAVYYPPGKRTVHDKSISFY